MTMTAQLTRRPRSRQTPVAAVLLAVTAACWAYLVLLRSEMGTMGEMRAMGEMTDMGTSRSVLAMPMTSAWSVSDAMLMWTMWAVMMAAMMIPSATPMIQAYDRTIASKPQGPSQALSGSTSLFVTGYLVAWSGFAAAATGAQWLLHDASLVNAMGTSTSRWVAGPVLVLAGTYQFSSLKNACLGKCRTPLGFLLSEWRSGRRGALVMGAHHGSLCIGCCWALMALLFVLGVMNLWWIALVATVVLVEKVTRNGRLPRILGVLLIAWGAVVLTGLVETGASA
jgi:predicted metal-binding membrane protein